MYYKSANYQSGLCAVRTLIRVCRLERNTNVGRSIVDAVPEDPNEQKRNDTFGPQFVEKARFNCFLAGKRESSREKRNKGDFSLHTAEIF
jgi:hypothetical protein